MPGAGSRRRWHSFTLVELLVAIGISSIILLVLLAMTTSLMTTWQFDQARNERRTNGQAILERISRDIQQAALPSSRGNTNSLQFVINPAGLSSTYELPQAVFWQAPVATDGSSAGNLAIVGYFVQWVNGVPSLSRLLINPSTAAYYKIYSSPTSWISDTILQNNASSSAASGYVGLLSENVLGLWVQALDSRGNPIQQTGLSVGNFDSRLSYASTNAVYPTVASTNMAPVLPSSVQIAIMVIDARTAKRLLGTEKPTSASVTVGFWDGIQTFYNSLTPAVKKGVEIQTATVDLANGPR